jgi:hypothetical protein
MLCIKIKIGVINDCLPINPNSAVRNNINGKIPMQSIKPISEAMPKKSFFTTELIIFLIIFKLFLKFTT